MEADNSAAEIPEPLTPQGEWENILGIDPLRQEDLTFSSFQRFNKN